MRCSETCDSLSHKAFQQYSQIQTNTLTLAFMMLFKWLENDLENEMQLHQLPLQRVTGE